MKSVYRIGLVLSVCLLLVAPVAVLAQTTGTIEGAITDQSGAALPGVTVELAGVHLQGARTAVTTADGHYRFLNLTPGDYTVTATLAGFGKVQKKATVGLDMTSQANLQLNLSTTAEVVVTGEAPLIDSTSTTSGSNFAGKVIDKLPLPSRNYADIVFTQPGVQADSGETQGRSLAISIYGSTSAENSFLIDGVNTTNVIKGIQGKDINNEFVQEVEVKTSGYQAEYGRNTGGVVNVITKSGGNEFHGGIFGYYNSLGLASDQVNQITPDNSQRGNSQTTTIATKNTRSEGGVDLGGYAWKDRVWFFGAYDRVVTGQVFNPTSGITGPLQPSYPDADCTVLAGCPFPDTITENKYSLKLTLNLAQSTTLQGVYFSDHQSTTGTIAGNPQSFNPLATQGRIDVGGPDYGARLNQLFGASGILTLSYGQHSDRFNTKPEGKEVPQLRDRTLTPFSYYGGYGQIFGPVVNNASTRQAYAGNYTGYVGNHEFKVGGDYEKVNTFGSTYWTGTSRTSIFPCSATRVCSGAAQPFNAGSVPGYSSPYDGPVYYEHQFFTPSGSDLTPLVDAPFATPTKRYSGFLQDQWRITPALTVNLGVRYDTETLYNGLQQKAFSLTNEWAPRFGVTWDFAGDGTSKLYASAGRFYYAIPTDLNVRVFTANTSIVSWNYDPGFSGSSLLQAPDAPTGRTQLTQVGSVAGEPTDKGLKAAYQDEFTIGVEKAIDPTLSVGIKGTYRSLGRTVEDRCDLDYSTNPTGSSCALMNPGATGIDNPGATGLYGSCNNSGNPTADNSCFQPGTPIPSAKRIFKGIELVVRKQFTNEIWAQLSYLGSTLTGNYSGAIREASGQTDPGINADFDYAAFKQNFSGRLELDRPNQGRIDAVYNAPWGLSAGVQFYVRTGTPTSINGYYNQFYTTELYLSKRGYAGRLPTDYEMNMSLGYNLNVGPVTITPMAYVFQLLNRQTATAIDQNFNPNGSFTDAGVAGIAPDGTCPVNSATGTCSDNVNYRKTTAQTGPRQFRFALKVTF